MQELKNLSDKELKRNIRSTRLNLQVSKREKDPGYLINTLEDILSQLIKEQNIRKEKQSATE